MINAKKTNGADRIDEANGANEADKADKADRANRIDRVDRADRVAGAERANGVDKSKADTEKPDCPRIVARNPSLRDIQVTK